MRNTSGLKRTAGPGRPKGAKNKISHEIQQFFESPAYAVNAKTRILDGKAPHLETYWLNKLNGKPTESIELGGTGGGPVRVEFVILGAQP